MFTHIRTGNTIRRFAFITAFLLFVMHFHHQIGANLTNIVLLRTVRHQIESANQRVYDGCSLMVCAYLYDLTGDQNVQFPVDYKSNPQLLFHKAGGDRKATAYQQSLQSIELLASQYPDSPLIHDEKLQTLQAATLDRLDHRDQQAAQFYLTQVLDQGGTDEWFFFDVAEQFMASQQTDLAETFYRYASYFNPDKPKFHEYLQLVTPRLLVKGAITDNYILRLISFLYWQKKPAELTELLSALEDTTDFEQFGQPYTQSTKQNTRTVPESLASSEVATLLQLEPDDVILSRNLLEYGDFEEGVKDQPFNWMWAVTNGKSFSRALFRGGLDEQNAFQGNNALRISGMWHSLDKDKLTPRSGFYSEAFDLAPESFYVWSIWYKTDLLEAGNAALLLDMFEGAQAGNYTTLPPTNGQWRQFIIVGRTPTNCCKRVKAFFASFALGNVWYDHITLRQINFARSMEGIQLPRQIVSEQH